jgi:hypothetical protein
MFLPVLLVRDYGIWGFVVFAVPNVLGAAAMGWIGRDRMSSASLPRRHGAAMGAFSLVTLAFQLFFMGTLGLGESDLWFSVVRFAGVGLVFLLWALADRSSAQRATALVLTAFSLFALFTYVRREGLEWPPLIEDRGVMWLAPVCAFGFLLCPYLDRTFHRARAEAGPVAARVAFTCGFCVLFSCMIAFTLAYRDWILEFSEGRASERIVDGLHAIVLAHIYLQLSFTIGVHGAESATRSRPRSLALLGGALALALIIPTIAAIVDRPALPTREVAYRMFMGFYGLVFPAYVWLCMIPTRQGHSGTAGAIGRRRLLVWGAAVAIAAPAFWMGFIERQEWWLAPGLAVVLLARLLIPGGRGFGRPPREPSGAPVPAPIRPPTLAAHARPGPGPGDA